MMKLPNKELSYWTATTPGSIYPELKENLETDVAVVGGGMAGLSAAYLLKQTGLKVAVIEKDAIGAGVSGHTTGKVTSQHNLIYAKLRKRLGADKAYLYAEANQTAIERMNEIIIKEKIDCDWDYDDNYVFTTESSQVAAFKEEVVAAQACGLPATFEVETTLPFPVQGAVRFTKQAKFHTRKYLLGLAKAIHGNGSFVFEDSRVIGIRDGEPSTIRTSNAKISAKHIIVATNVPTFPLMARGGYCALEYPLKSYIVAGRIDHEQKGMYISPDDGEYSILPITSGSERLLLIGGEGHIPGTRVNPAPRFERLATYAKERFGIESIDYKWSARDYLAYDDIPLIGKLYPWSKNVYVATAFMKWGLTNGTVAGMVLSDLITGENNPWAAAFNPNRLKPITSIPKVMREVIGG